MTEARDPCQSRCEDAGRVAEVEGGLGLAWEAKEAAPAAVEAGQTRPRLQRTVEAWEPPGEEVEAART